jgi:hypothetical protein
MVSLRPAAIGIAAALRVPFWIGGTRLQRALNGNGGDQITCPREATSESPPNDRELAHALRASMISLRVLARLRPVWRNTCLYRSLTQWLVLRAYGRDASVRIGVGLHSQEANEDSAVTAHAWVDYDGPEPVEMPTAEYATLRRPRISRAGAALRGEGPATSD